MAKVSVSIPDDLLDRARLLDASANTSQLVQRGLEQLTAHLAAGGEADYAKRPEGVDGQLASAQAALVANARTEFQQGYRIALEDVGDIDWSVMEKLADAKFDLLSTLSRWQNNWGHADDDEGFHPPKWFGRFMTRFGSMIDPIGIEEYNFKPSRPFVRGYAAALRDAWASIEPEAAGANDAETSA
jgi:hypothetical protein